VKHLNVLCLLFLQFFRIEQTKYFFLCYNERSIYMFESIMFNLETFNCSIIIHLSKLERPYDI
jgi:hypothetical protein